MILTFTDDRNDVPVAVLASEILSVTISTVNGTSTLVELRSGTVQRVKESTRLVIEQWKAAIDRRAD
jgi:hypothetical protein